MKNDYVQALLDQHDGNMGEAARAAGTNYPRFRKWIQRKATDDAQLRCWLALEHPRILATYHARRAIKAVRDAA